MRYLQAIIAPTRNPHYQLIQSHNSRIVLTMPYDDTRFTAAPLQNVRSRYRSPKLAELVGERSHIVSPSTKYRDNDEQRSSLHVYGNIMSDPRVYRGSVYNSLNQGHNETPSTQQKAVKKDRRKKQFTEYRTNKYETVAQLHEQTHVVKKHIPVPLHLYLEENDQLIVELDDREQQTDEFLPAELIKPYIPPKRGLNAATQVIQGELYDFDVHVSSIVETITSQTIEQALMEVREEHELAYIRKATERYLNYAAREAEHIQIGDCKQNNVRAASVKAMRSKEDHLAKQTITKHKIMSRQLTKEYLRDFERCVMHSLEEQRVFFNPTEMEIDEGYMPSLCNDVSHEVQQHKLAIELIEDIIESAAGTLAQDEIRMVNSKIDAVIQLQAIEQEKKKPVRVLLRCAELGDAPVGPINLQKGDLVSTLQAQIRAYLARTVPDSNFDGRTMRLLLETGELMRPEQMLLDVSEAALSNLMLDFVSE